MRTSLPNNHPMWHKTMHEKYGLFNEEYKSAGDHEMWLRAVKMGSRFLKINKILGVYYHNPKGLSTNKETGIGAYEYEKLLKEYQELFGYTKLGNQLKQISTRKLKRDLKRQKRIERRKQRRERRKRRS